MAPMRYVLAAGLALNAAFVGFCALGLLSAIAYVTGALIAAAFVWLAVAEQ